MESDDGQRDPDAAADAYRRGMGLLVRREQSRRELSRKLAQRGFAADLAEEVVARLGEQGYQDDARFAAAFARDRAASGYGPLRIRQDLAGHGLDRDQVDAALAACETDWSRRAADIARRRFRPAELADPARRRKAVDFLIRRGFTQESALAAMRQAASGEPDT